MPNASLTTQTHRWNFAAVLTAGLFLISPHALAQNGRPVPVQPNPQGVDQPAGRPNPTDDPATAVPGAANGSVNSTGPVRRGEVKEGKVVLAFNDVQVDEVIPFIVESTGKVVMPVNLVALKTKKITLMNDQPVERAQALDLLVTALRLNGVGVIETEDVVILDLRENIRTVGALPVLSANEDVMNRRDYGTFVVKIYRLREAQAEGVGERIQDNLPDFATLGVDINSNQIILAGDVGLAQHVQQLINELDRNHISVKTQTFVLKYADATAVADQIYELFDESGSNANAGQPRTNRGNARGGARGGAAPGQPGAGGAVPGISGPGPVVELRVSVNVRQNAMTVQSDPTKMEKIRELVEQYWDLPTAQETAKVYKLAYTDPLKVRDLLQNLLGAGGSSSSGGGRTGGGGRQNVPGGINQAGGANGGGGAAAAVGDIYRIEAYPDANSIVVLSKTKDSLDYLDGVVEAIDQPSTVGLPQIIELKHANAVSLAEEINVLLAEAGTRVSLDRPPSGLTGQGPGGLGDDGDTSGGATGGGRTGGDTGGGGSAGAIEFPWQSGQTRDDQSPESSLIGKVRIVPIVRQNALAVLAPPDKRQPVADLIKTFDRPGRQVMISAVIVEVELNDDLALGIRFGSGALTSSSADNSLGISTTTEGTREDFLGDMFTSSVLDVNADLNVLIQALNEKSNVKILQEPRVFTADNQEAIFFNGQDIPFITNSNTVDTGGITQSFEYKQVGVFLNVRPRITVQRDVDLEVNLEISNVVPGQTLFGGAILDRRQTTTQVIVKNGQTIVLSGIMRNSESSTTRGIPLLSDIPWIGEIFTSRDNSKTSSELIAFITPIVVDNPSENDDNFNRQDLEHLKELAKPLKETYKKAGQRARDRIINSRDEIREAAEQYEMVDPAPTLSPSGAVERPVPNNVDPIDVDAPVDVEELTEEPPDR